MRVLDRLHEELDFYRAMINTQQRVIRAQNSIIASMISPGAKRPQPAYRVDHLVSRELVRQASGVVSDDARALYELTEEEFERVIALFRVWVDERCEREITSSAYSELLWFTSTVNLKHSLDLRLGRVSGRTDTVVLVDAFGVDERRECRGYIVVRSGCAEGEVPPKLPLCVEGVDGFGRSKLIIKGEPEKCAE